MGLDQYAYARKGVPVIELEEYTTTCTETGKEIKQIEEHLIWENQMELAYWRKHPNLQGWMEQLWRDKGNEGEFNCVDVELIDADLDRLEADIKGNNLPDTGGFFFGSNSDDSYKDGDLDFVHDAREHLSMGYKIVYTSWW